MHRTPAQWSLFYSNGLNGCVYGLQLEKRPLFQSEISFDRTESNKDLQLDMFT